MTKSATPADPVQPDDQLALALARILYSMEIRKKTPDLAVTEISKGFIAARPEFLPVSRQILRLLHARGYTLSKTRT